VTRFLAQHPYSQNASILIFRFLSEIPAKVSGNDFPLLCVAVENVTRSHWFPNASIYVDANDVWFEMRD